MQMSEQTESGHVRHRVNLRQLGQLDSRGIELGHGFEHLLVRLGTQLAFFERCTHDADAERLAEYQHVACLRAIVALDAVRMHHAQRHEAVDRLRVVD